MVIAMNKGGEIKEQCKAIVKILLLVTLLFFVSFLSLLQYCSNLSTAPLSLPFY
jgi:hypothetical protein